MENSVHSSVDFFLGATTPAGFKGYFAPLRREPGMQLVLLKSGPGCGKSTLMKRLARAAQEKGEEHREDDNGALLLPRLEGAGGLRVLGLEVVASLFQRRFRHRKDRSLS